MFKDLMSQQHSSKQAPVIADGLTLGIVGAGVMGQTLIRGLVTSGLISPSRLWAGDKNPSACERASQELGVPAEPDYQRRVPTADLILMCVKPADAPVVLATLRNGGLRRETLLISILAGVSTDQIETLLGAENPVVRAMPNTPAIVGEGMTVVCRGSSFTPLRPTSSGPSAYLKRWASASPPMRSISTRLQPS